MKIDKKPKFHWVKYRENQYYHISKETSLNGQTKRIHPHSLKG